MPKEKSDFDKWSAAAAALGKVQNPLRIPFDIANEEAASVAGFLKRRWAVTADLPGMEQAKKRVPLETGNEITSLLFALGFAQTSLLILIDPAAKNHGDRARFVIDELESAMEFTLDDDVEEPADAQLASIQKFHAQDGQRTSALVQSLRDNAALAETLKARLVADDSAFDVTLIPEAKKLADTMAALPAEVAPTSDEAQQALLVRNQLLVLIDNRVRAIRKTAAHVFRRHPEILHEATSSYERRRRTAARRAKNAKDDASEPKPG